MKFKIKRRYQLKKATCQALDDTFQNIKTAPNQWSHELKTKLYFYNSSLIKNDKLI